MHESGMPCPILQAGIDIEMRGWDEHTHDISGMVDHLAACVSWANGVPLKGKSSKLL
jgi:hypothetical protein